MKKNLMIAVLVLIVVGLFVYCKSGLFIENQSASSIRSNVSVPLGSKNSNTKPTTPLILTMPTQTVGSTSATLFGQVTTNGIPTNVWFFVFNTQPSLIMQTPMVLINNVGAISTPVSYPISGLSPSTTYMYEMCASNSSTGFTCSHIEKFTTPAIINPDDPIYTN
jgi:hypothetical protein